MNYAISNSKTGLIKENRLCRNFIDFLIKSTKQGIFETSFTPLTKEKSIYAETCKIKSCQGELRFNMYESDIKKKFTCLVCDRKQGYRFLETKVEIQSREEIDKFNSIGNFHEKCRIQELEFIGQQLRNFYRILVDDLEPEPIMTKTHEKWNEYVKLHNDIHEKLITLRQNFIISYFDDSNKVSNFHHAQVYSLIKNGKLMTFDELNQSLHDSKHKTMLLVDNIIHQFSQKNLMRIVLCNIANESKKRTSQPDKIKKLMIEVTA